MKYVVIEIQKLSTEAIANQVWGFDDILSAEAKYHALLSVAAKSSVYVHTVCLINETGFMIKHESYDHTPAPEPEPDEVDE